jgi:hypothetical protein
MISSFEAVPANGGPLESHADPTTSFLTYYYYYYLLAPRSDDRGPLYSRFVLIGENSHKPHISTRTGSSDRSLPLAQGWTQRHSITHFTLQVVSTEVTHSLGGLVWAEPDVHLPGLRPAAVITGYTLAKDLLTHRANPDYKSRYVDAVPIFSPSGSRWVHGRAHSASAVVSR